MSPEGPSKHIFLWFVFDLFKNFEETYTNFMFQKKSLQKLMAWNKFVMQTGSLPSALNYNFPNPCQYATVGHIWVTPG